MVINAAGGTAVCDVFNGRGGGQIAAAHKGETLRLPLFRGLIRDNHTDLQAGRSVGCHTVLIADGPDSQTAQQAAGTEKQPGHIATGLDGAVDWMLKKLMNSPEGVQLLPLGNVAKEVLNG